MMICLVLCLAPPHPHPVPSLPMFPTFSQRAPVPLQPRLHRQRRRLAPGMYLIHVVDTHFFFGLTINTKIRYRGLLFVDTCNEKIPGYNEILRHLSGWISDVAGQAVSTRYHSRQLAMGFSRVRFMALVFF